MSLYIEHHTGLKAMVQFEMEETAAMGSLKRVRVPRMTMI